MDQSRVTRDDSVATAYEDNQPTLDKIETAGDRRHDSDDKSLDQKPTAKDVAHPSKRHLFLHHRHQKDLSRHFTPGSIPSYLKIFSHSSSDEKKTTDDPEAQTKHDAEVTAPLNIWQNIMIMCTTFPYWNMAFWSGWCYSIGSAMFIVDGCWAWIPVVYPETEFHGQSEYGVPLWFFFGACLYQIGGVMAYLEAVNDGSFAGAAMKRLLEGHQDIEKELLDTKLHAFFGHIVPHHHHEHDEDQDNQLSQTMTGSKSLDKTQTDQSTYDEVKEKVERRGGVDSGPPKEGQVRNYLTWRWWPTWHAFKTYHIYELGYVACAIQLFGVTLYGVTSIVVLPGILENLEWWQKLGAYWVPQVVASCCFLIASIMFTIMAQDRWNKPKWNACSWWIGITAQAGSVGFLLCAVFGLFSHTHEWAEVQSSVSSTWGSFFYMLSGLFQWYEAININVGPVLAFPNNRTPVMLRKVRS